MKTFDHADMDSSFLTKINKLWIECQRHPILYEDVWDLVKDKHFASRRDTSLRYRVTAIGDNKVFLIYDTRAKHTRPLRVFLQGLACGLQEVVP